MTPEQTSASTRPGWGEWTLVALLAVDLIWTTLCLGGYRPETMVVTSSLTGATLLVWLMLRLGRNAKLRVHPAGWWLLPFILYAAGNVIWVTPVAWLGWHDWLWWAQMVAVFWVVLNGVNAPRSRMVLLATLAALGFAAVVLAAYQRFVRPDWLMLGRVQSDQFIGRASGPFGIPNSLGGLLLLLLPATLALACRRGAPAVQRVLFGYLACTYLFGLVLTVSRGAWIALAVALSLWPLFGMRRGWLLRLGSVVLAALVCIGAGWGLYRMVPLVHERFDQMAAQSGEWTRPIMWRGAWQLFRGHPWFGSGAGSYNVLFESYRPEKCQMEPQWAHNDYLNTLSDYGVAGFILFFGAVFFLVAVCFRGRRAAAPAGRRGSVTDDPLFWQGLAIGLLAFALQLAVDFHFKIPALAAAFAMMGALLVRRHWPVIESGRRIDPRWSRIGSALTAALLAGAIVCLVTPHYRAEAARYAARQMVDTLWRLDVHDAAYRPILDGSLRRLEAAVLIDPANGQAWADLSYATTLRAHVEAGSSNARLGREAEDYADRALALSAVVPEFWIRRAIARDMQGRWFPAGNDLVKALMLAPASAPVWYYQAYHLSLRPAGLPQARAAVAFCLRLDPNHPTAQLLRQQLATDR